MATQLTARWPVPRFTAAFSARPTRGGARPGRERIRLAKLRISAACAGEEAGRFQRQSECREIAPALALASRVEHSLAVVRAPATIRFRLPRYTGRARGSPARRSTLRFWPGVGAAPSDAASGRWGAPVAGVMWPTAAFSARPTRGGARPGRERIRLAKLRISAA
jgi:hypothetical protein